MELILHENNQIRVKFWSGERNVWGNSVDTPLVEVWKTYPWIQIQGYLSFNRVSYEGIPRIDS